MKLWLGDRPRPRPHWVRSLDADPVAPKRGTAPIFGPCLLWPNGRPSQLLLSTCSSSYAVDGYAKRFAGQLIMLVSLLSHLLSYCHSVISISCMCSVRVDL